MAKVIAFPQQNKLPKGVETRIHEIAKEYIEVLHAYAILVDLEDQNVYQEAMELVGAAFAEGILKAVDELGEI